MSKTSMAPRMSLQDMVKSAMDQGVHNARVNEEAERQRGLALGGTKTASAEPRAVAAPVVSEEDIPTEDALKLASALEYGLEWLKQSSINLPKPSGGGTVEPGKGPGALHVTQATSDSPISLDPGKAHNQGPTPGLQTGQSGSKTQLKNDLDHPSPQKMASAPYALLLKAANSAEAEKKETEGMAAAEKGLAKAEKAHAAEGKDEKKEASGDAFLDYLLARPTMKTAEDAINPARISAGSAVPPNTSASGEAGGAPAGGPPQGPRGLIASNEAAINYTRRDAYGNRKSDLHAFLTEPAMTSATDKVLGNAFAHTGEAGAKIASTTVGMAKVAAGRALLTKLAQAVSDNKNIPTTRG